MEPQIVTYHGLHWDSEDVAYLVQGRSMVNAVGLKKPAPFVVKLPGKARDCNHQISLTTTAPNEIHWTIFTELMEDPLVQAMLPLPKGSNGVYFIDGGWDLPEYLGMLSRMSSPLHPIVVPFWLINQIQVAKELHHTNVAPFVIYDMAAKGSITLAAIAGVATRSPRRLIVHGGPDVIVPTQMERISTKLNTEKYNKAELMGLPWEALGTHLIRLWMRKQWKH